MCLYFVCFFCAGTFWSLFFFQTNRKKAARPSLLAFVGSRQYEARFKSRSRSKTGSPRRKKVSHSRSRPAWWQRSWKVKLLQVVFVYINCVMCSFGGWYQVNLSELSELTYSLTVPNPWLRAWPMFVLLEIGPRCQKRCQIFQLVLSPF